MKTYAYHLHFDAPLHIGIEGIGQERIEEIVGSDTLWGALVQCWALLYEDDIAALAAETDFRLSSAFPFRGPSRYYPVPAHFLEIVAPLVVQQGWDFKPLKKIRYVCEDLFVALCRGEKELLSTLKNSDSCWPSPWPSADKDIETGFFTVHQRPRLRIDRLTGGSEEGGFFYCSDLYFKSNCGLHFLVQLKEELQEKFEASLRLLGEQGLGADRSIGRGRFRFTRFEVSWPGPDANKPCLLLSTCLPSARDLETVDFSSSRVVLKIRRGHAGAASVSHLRRPDLVALGEGSYLSRAPQGHVPVVIHRDKGAPHDVYRYGRAFTVPCADGFQGGSDHD